VRILAFGPDYALIRETNPAVLWHHTGNSSTEDQAVDRVSDSAVLKSFPRLTPIFRYTASVRSRVYRHLSVLTRVKSLGQNKPVFVTRFIIRDTIGEPIAVHTS
jgi:SNF2 family DNA or RNA helicase